MRALVFLVAPVGLLSAQQPQRIALGAKTGELKQAMTQIASVRELRDGRVLVLDAREHEVYLADLGTQQAGAVGRRGQGPLEYARPLHLIALPDASTLVQDPGNARFLEIDATGRVKGTVEFEAGKGGAVSVPPRSIGMEAWGVDASGRLYFEPYPKEAGTTLQASIVRLDPGRASVDTVASYTMPTRTGAYSVSSPSSNEFVVRVHVWNPRSQWSVASDGRIALVEPDPYRVSWLVDGKRVDGAPQRYVPLRVSETDREAYLEGRGRPAGNTGPAPRGTPVKREGEPIFPQTMPPFVGREALLMAPDGHVWVARTRNVTDPVQTYDVFDNSGRLTGRAELPPRRRIVGFGAREVYVVHRDGDDLEYLERYRR